MCAFVYVQISLNCSLRAMILPSVLMEHEVVMGTIEKPSISINIGHGFACVYMIWIPKSNSVISGIVFSPVFLRLKCNHHNCSQNISEYC